MPTESQGGATKELKPSELYPLEGGAQVIKPGDQDARRARMARKVQVYENDWKDILTEELTRQFAAETAQYIKLMLDTSQNIFRRIIRETSTVYMNGVTRGLLTPEGEDIESPEFADLVDLWKLDWMLAEAQRMAKAASICFIRVRSIPADKRLQLELMSPDVVHVELRDDNPLEMKSFSYIATGTDAQGRPLKCWVYYDKDQRLFLAENGRNLGRNPFSDDPADSDPRNKYGVIPVIPYHAAAPSRGFWREKVNEDAYDANLVIGVLATYLSYLVKTQSFKQIVFTRGETGDALDKSLLNGISDPLFPFVIPFGSTAATLDLNAQVGQIDAVIRGKVAAIANNFGISNENFTLSGNVASGFSLRVANRALEEIRRADKEVAYETERQLFNLMRLMQNMDYASEATIPDTAELDWNPGEIEYPPTWEEEEARWRFEFEFDVANAVDYLIKADPDLTRDEAIEKIKQVADENKTIKPQTPLTDMLFGKPAKPGMPGEAGGNGNGANREGAQEAGGRGNAVAIPFRGSD